MTDQDAWARGMQARREVLGDEYVDRANEARTELTADFQDLITRYAWGDVWTRPGLSRRERSMVTITALIARSYWDELALHIRAALNNGVTEEELAEVILNSAVYCGVPAANHAFGIAQQVTTARDGRFSAE